MPRGRKAAATVASETADAAPKKRGRKSTAGTGGKHHDQYVQLGLTVSYYRKLKGLSQGELAEKAGCSRGHISALEAPGLKTSVSIESLLDISDALNVPVAKFFETK